MGKRKDGESIRFSCIGNSPSSNSRAQAALPAIPSSSFFLYGFSPGCLL